MLAGWPYVGSGATSQSNVRDRPERRGRPGGRTSASPAGRWRTGSRRPRPRPPRRSGRRRTPCAGRRSSAAPRGACGVSRVNRVGAAASSTMLAAVGPDERREPDHRRLDAQPVHGRPLAPPSDSVPFDLTAPPASRVSAAAVATMSFQVQPGFGSATPYLPEQVAVVVDGEAGDVLRQAQLLAAPAERVHRRRVEVVRLDRRRTPRSARRAARSRPSRRTGRRSGSSSGTGRAAARGDRGGQRAIRSSRSLASTSWMSTASATPTREPTTSPGSIPSRAKNNAIKQLNSLGYDVTITPATAA